jgi:hypothetical protein
MEVDKPEHAEWVRHNPTKWYNADYDTPAHSFKPEELEVVKVTIVETEETLNVTIPTRLDIYEIKSRKDKEYKRIIEDYLMECVKNKIDPTSDYSARYYDVMEVIKDAL